MPWTDRAGLTATFDKQSGMLELVETQSPNGEQQTVVILIEFLPEFLKYVEGVIDGYDAPEE